MSYEIVVGQDKLFGNDCPLEKINPTMNITVDFKHRNIYEMFMNKVYYDYAKQVMPNISKIQINHHILLKLLELHPELNDEVVEIVKNLNKDELNKDELKKEFFDKILPKFNF